MEVIRPNQPRIIIFFSTKTFPPTTADHFYISDFSKSMSKIKEIDYYLVLNRKRNFNFEGINCIELKLIKNGFLKSTLFQLLYKIPILFRAFKQKKVIFITNDKYVGIVLRFWNSILFQRHTIVGDWHHKSSPLVDRLFLQSCDKNIYISSGMKKYAEQISTNNIGGNSILSPMGVNPNTFDIELSKRDARTELNLPIGKKIFGYFGRFTTFGQEKGIRICLESLIDLPDDYFFVAAGATEEDLNTYTKIAKELQVFDKMTLLGTQSQSKLAIYQKACDVLVAPYPNTPHYAHNMSPMKLFEYMVAKRPIVASRLDSMTSIIDEGIFYFNPDDKLDFIIKIIDANNLDEHSDRVVRVYNDAFKYSWDSKAKLIVSFLNRKA